jgi:hypothetical protein
MRVGTRGPRIIDRISCSIGKARSFDMSDALYRTVFRYAIIALRSAALST